MATISEQERKRIQRYCIYPKIAGAALAMAFVLPFLIIPFEMIDDIVFHHEGFQETGMMTALALTAIELVIFCYCALAPRFGMRGKQWKEMQHRLVVEQTEKDRSAQIAGVIGTQAAARLLKNSDNETARNLGGAAEVAAAVGAVATAADVLTESYANAKAMAEAYSVPIPRAKKWIIALVALPLAIVCGAYIPQLAQGNIEMQENAAAAAEQIAIARKTLEPACEYVSADDPYERYQDYGYHVRGYLHEGDSDTQKTYTYLDFDTKGTLKEVSYIAEIDPDASLEDNLARIEFDLDELSSVVQTVDVKTVSPELLAPQKLPEEFRQAFLNGSLYERISIRTSDDPIKTYYSFDTEPEDEFDEYTHPSIRITLVGKTS